MVSNAHNRWEKQVVLAGARLLEPAEQRRHVPGVPADPEPQVPALGHYARDVLREAAARDVDDALRAAHQQYFLVTGHILRGAVELLAWGVPMSQLPSAYSEECCGVRM